MTEEALIVSPAEPSGRPRFTNLLAVRGYRPLCISSWLWHTTRWGGLFSTSYLLTQIADSPLLNQIAGALIFAPMLVGGFFAGVLSDRVERRRLILRTQLILIPISFLMFVMVASGYVRVWMTFPFMFAVGIGGLVNMTAQRPLLYETVGPRLAAQALTIETIAQASASVFGTVAGGVLIQAVGIRGSFAGMTILLCISAALLTIVPTPQAVALPATRAPLRSQLRSSAGLVTRSRRFAAMLGVTVIMNLFYFSFIPLVPVIAAQFGANAVLAGALSAMAGIGQITASAVLSFRSVRHHGLVFAVGACISFIGLLLFSSAPMFALAFLALIVAGVGQSGFASMQSLLAIESASESERGAALGVLSTAIGAMPLGMILVGVAAEALGARPALLISAGTGLALLLWLMSRSPELLTGAARRRAFRGFNTRSSDRRHRRNAKGMQPPVIASDETSAQWERH